MNTTNRILLIVLLCSINHFSFASVRSEEITEAYEAGSPLEALAPGDPVVSITGTTSFCIGSSNAEVTFEAAGGTAPYTFTYSINGGPSQNIQCPGTGSSVQVPVNTAGANVFTYTITGVRNATGKVIPVIASATINVVEGPVANFTFTGGGCSSSPVKFTSTVAGPGSYTYTWDFGDGEISTESNPSHLFSALGCGTGSYPVSLTVSDINGCSITINKTINLLQKPDISFSDEDAPFGEPFNNCVSASAANPDYAIRVGNTSPSIGCISTYTINWGDGTALVNNATFPANHTYNRMGSFNMVITARGTNGCTNSVTYVVKNVTNPSVGITSPGTTTNLCAPTPQLQFMIANWGGNSPGTTYTVNYGDGTGITTYTQEQLEATAYFNAANPASSANFPIPHSYTTTNCPNAPYTVTLIASNSCSQTVATVNNITILTPTAPDFSAPLESCVNTSVAFTNTSVTGYNTSCNPTSTYTWSFGDGTTEVVTSATPRNTNHTYTTPGTYQVVLSSRNLCGTTTATQTVVIKPPVTAGITANASGSASVSVCQGDATSFITFTGSNGIAPYTFYYQINNGPVRSISTSATSNSVMLPVPTGTAGTFTYTILSIDGFAATECSEPQTGRVTFDVSPPPSATIDASGSACQNGPSPQVTFTGNNGTAPYTFYYTINGGPIQQRTTTSGNSVTINVPTNVLGTFVYTLVRVQDSRINSCNQSTVNSSATVTISAPPSAIVQMTDLEYCVGENTPGITFPNTPGITYHWTNSNPAIGLGASGNSNIPSFRTRNTTGNPMVATIRVTPSNIGCDGPVETFNITVYPPVVVNFSLGNQTICSGDGTQVVTLSSPTPGSTFAWTSTQPAGITGVVTSGTNTIPSQTLINNTNAPITVTYRATGTSPQTTNCAGVDYIYTITVNPIPVVAQSISQTVCSGSAFSVSPQNGSGNVIPSGIRYTWTAPTISPAGSLTGGSAQNSPQPAVSQTLVNTTNAPATATYSVTPVANGCTGTSYTIVITVLPLPRAAITGNATVCQNGTASVTFTGSGGMAPYKFTYRINNGTPRTETTISGNSITIPVTTTTAGTYIYTLVSVEESSNSACSQSQSGSVTINVNATPTANISGSTSACLNGTSPDITLTGSGGTAPYTFTYNINGGPNETIVSQSGNRATITVPTNVAGLFRYNLVGVADASANACSQTLTRSATITINQTPAPMTLPDQEYCNGEVTPVITLTNTVAGTTYIWTNSNPSIGLAAGGSSAGIPSFTTNNITTDPVISTITVRPRVNGCDGASETFTITVYPSTVIFVPGDQTICSGDNTEVVTLGSNIPGATFSWTATPPAGITGVVTSGDNTIPVQRLINTTTAPITVIYRAMASSAVTANCEGVEHNYRITVNPMPVVGVNHAQDICSGDGFNVNLTDLAVNPHPSNIGFIWNAPVVSPAGSVSGTSAQVTPVATLSQPLVNTTMSVATVTYSVIPVTNGCQGTPFTVTAFVYPLPSAAITGDVTVCQDDASQSITFTGSGGTAPYTFTYNINGGPDQQITTLSGNSRAITIPTDTEGSFTYNIVRISDSRNNGCTRNQTVSATVTVTQKPTATISGTATACLNEPNVQVAFTATGGIAPYTFSYNVNGGPVQSATTISGNSYTINVPTNVPGTFAYNLMSVRNTGASGCLQSLNESAVVTVSPPPAPFAVQDWEFCYGVISPEITFSSPTAGTTFTWTNSNPEIGLDASGEGSIPEFMTRNNTNNSITSTITVTPSLNGCEGIPQTFVITVRPPVIIFTPGDQTICSGENTAEVVLRSNVIGAVFKWLATEPAGITGMATSGGGIIPVQTLVNSTNEPIVVTYKAMATSPGINDCEWVEYTYTVTVNPMPVITANENRNICSGSTFSVSPQDGGGNSIPSGTSFIWGDPVISPAGAITGASSQTIPQSTISQTLENNTSAVATATYTVTPVANGCEGAAFVFVVSVDPMPTVNAVNNITLCNNEQNAEVVFTGNVPGTVYRWSSDNTNIGMADAGMGNVPGFTAVNNTPSPVTATISVVPTIVNGSSICEGEAIQFTITVNPTGQVNNPGDQSVCSGNNLSLNFTTNNTGGTTTYEWTNSNPSIGLAASGTGNITFMPVNTGNTILTTSITVVPVYLNNGVRCAGNEETFTLDVYPAATLEVVADQELCNGDATQDIRFTGNLVNATYQWTTDNPSIGLAASGTGDIASFTAVNHSPVPVVATITVTPEENSCPGTPVSFKITVNPSPLINRQPLSSTICLGETPPALIVAAVNGTGTPSYQWYSNTLYSKAGATLIPNETSVSYDPPATVAGTMYYYCEITFQNVGCNLLSSELARVTINPNPVISAISMEINNGEVFTVVPLAANGNIIPPGTTYTWSDPIIDPANSIIGASAQSTPQTSISQQLTNTTSGLATVTYTVTPTSGSCSGATFQVIIRVKNQINPNVVVNPVNCSGMNDGSITTNVEGGVPFTTGAPYTILWTGPNGYTSSSASISNLRSGVYNLTVTDASGVEFTASYTITEPEGIQIVTDAIKQISCFGAADGGINISVTGGTGALKISWTKDNQAFGTNEDISNLSPGTYLVSVTDATNCGPKVLSYVITQPEPLVVSLDEKADILCSDASTGSISIQVIGGISPYQYAWSGPDGFTSSAMNPDNLPAGMYNLVVTDSNGCKQPLTVTLIEPLPITVSSAISPISCFGANDASARINITGGTSPYRVVWDNQFTGINQNNLAAGNYNITITDANQCQVTTMVTIQEAPTFTINPIVKNVSCIGAQNGSITLNFESESSDITLTWADNASAGSTRNNLAPGTYTVSFNLAGRSLCNNTRTFVITQPEPLTVSLQEKKDVNCFSNSTGSIRINVTGGVAAYQYAWTGPNGFTSAAMNLDDLPAGHYNLIVTDFNGCRQSLAVTLSEPLPLRPTSVITPVSCFGENDASATINISGGTAPYVVRWDNQFTGIYQDNLAVGNHSVTITDANQCQVTTTVTILEAPTFTVNPVVKNVTCIGAQNGSIILNFESESSDITLTWADNASAGSTRTNLAPGTYTVSFNMAGRSLCNNIRTFIISEPQPLIVALDEKEDVKCFSDSTGSIRVNVTGGVPAYQYAWSGPNGFTSTAMNLDNLSAGNYNLMVTDNNGCRQSLAVTISEPNPLKATSTITPVSCIGENDASATININGGTAPYVVRWDNQFTGIYQDNLAPGNYSVTITDANQCQVITTVTILEAPTFKVSPIVKNVTCHGAQNGSITLNFESESSEIILTWADNASAGSARNNLAAGTYTVTFSLPGRSLCNNIQTFVITQPEPLTVSLQEKEDVKCFSGSTGSIRVNVTGGVPAYQYAWTGPNGFTSTTLNLDDLSAGNYNLMVTDNSGCRQSLAVTISEPNPLKATSTITPVSCIGENDASATINISGGTSPYLVQWDNQFTGIYQDNLAVGNYLVTITDANQCQVTTALTILEAPTFTIDPVVKNATCHGAQNGSITLNFESQSSDITLSWSDNNSTASVRNNLAPGTYTVTFNRAGRSFCDNIRIFVITEPMPMALTGVVTDLIDCSDDANGAIDINVTGGTPPYSYSWSNGAISEDLTNLQAGNYVVTVTDSLGCLRVAQYTVNRPAPLEVDVNSIVDYDCDSKEVVAVNTAMVKGGMPPYQLTWSSGDVSGELNEIMKTALSGTIQLKVVDALGCSANHSINVEIPDSGVESQLLDCNNHSYQFNGITFDASDKITYHWDFGDGTTSNLKNPVHNYREAGRYHVVLLIAIANSCTSTYEETIDVEFPPMVGIDKEAKFCIGDSILIYGTGADSYRWNDGSTGDSIWISAVGNYSVTGTSEAGCEATYNFPASYYDGFNYTIQSDLQEVSGGQDRIHFWTQSTPYSSYTWDFGDGQLGQGGDLYHTYEITEDGYFDIKLRVINPYGCIEETTKRIWKTITSIPNTFTPNGDDINDIYLKGWMIEVFNRNGILMYKGDEGWDGKHNDSPVNNDTYFVIVYDSTFTGAKYKTTYVTVLR